MPWGALAAAAVTAYSSYRQNKKRRKFAERMSNTAHQREVRDLRAAGLNPILSAGGKGASSPDPTPIDQARQFSSFSATQVQRKVAKATIAYTEAQTRLTTAKAISEELGAGIRGRATTAIDAVPKMWSSAWQNFNYAPESSRRLNTEAYRRTMRKAARRELKMPDKTVIERKTKTPEQLMELSRPRRLPGAEQEIRIPIPKRKKGESKRLYLSRIRAWRLLMERQNRRR